MTRSRVKPTEEDVKRPYSSAVRDEQAVATRRRIRDAAETLFLINGYVATSMSAIADAAGVSRPTVFNSFGSKVALLKEIADVRLAGDDAPIDLLSRPRGRRITSATDPHQLLAAQAAFAAEVMERVAPLMEVVAHAAATDPDAAELQAAQEMGRFHGIGAAVDRLAELGALRPGLTPTHAKEAIFLISGLEPWLLAKRRGWSRRRYEQWWLQCATALLLPNA
jgi:AcrR family transcriptional regulator